MDRGAGLSTIMAIYVDKWQKNRHPSTYKPDYVDGETGSSMKTALSVDDSSPKAGMITLKDVDTANVTNSFHDPGRADSSVGQTGEGYPDHRLTGGDQSGRQAA